MKDIKLFEKWIKNAINKGDKKLIVNATEEHVYLTDGFIMFKIPRYNKDFIRVIQHNTFQTLKTNFMIVEKELKEETIDMLPCFPKDEGREVIKTNLILKDCYNTDIFLIKDTKELYFINTNHTQYVNLDYATSIKTNSKVSVALVKMADFEVALAPVRISHTPYKITYENNIYKAGEE